MRISSARPTPFQVVTFVWFVAMIVQAHSASMGDAVVLDGLFASFRENIVIDDDTQDPKTHLAIHKGGNLLVAKFGEVQVRSDRLGAVAGAKSIIVVGQNFSGTFPPSGCVRVGQYTSRNNTPTEQSFPKYCRGASEVLQNEFEHQEFTIVGDTPLFKARSGSVARHTARADATHLSPRRHSPERAGVLRQSGLPQVPPLPPAVRRGRRALRVELQCPQGEP